MIRIIIEQFLSKNGLLSFNLRNRTFIKDEYKDKLTYRYSVWYAYAYIAHNKKCKIEGQIYSTLSSHYTYTLRAFYDRSFMHFCHFFCIELFLLYHLCLEGYQRITLHKRGISLLDISRNYSNCMFYFHILAYNRGTSEAHFVAK